MRANFKHLAKEAVFLRLRIGAKFKHLAKEAVFLKLRMDAAFYRLFLAGVFTNKRPIDRTRYRTAGGIKRTTPNGSIRHV